MRAGRHLRESPSRQPSPVLISSHSQDKAALRRVLRQRRQAIGAAARARAERRFMTAARRWLKPGRKIGAYVAVGSEAPTAKLIELALARRCQVYVPQVPERGRLLRFVRVLPNSRWHTAHYAIPVPKLQGRQRGVRASQLAVVFVPLLGFDATLTRMGQGGGYYDASFAFRRQRTQPRLIGLAYACQQVALLPRDAWDLRLDAVLTEQGVLRATAAKRANVTA